MKTSADTAILAFEREKDGEKLIFIANLSNEPVSFQINYNESLKDYMASGNIELNEATLLTYEPWEYKILTSQ